MSGLRHPCWRLSPITRSSWPWWWDSSCSATCRTSGPGSALPCWRPAAYISRCASANSACAARRPIRTPDRPEAKHMTALTARDNRPKVPGLPRLVFLVMGPFALGYFLSYLFRSVNAVVGPDLVREFSLTAGELGLLTAAYLLAFALFQF